MQNINDNPSLPNQFSSSCTNSKYKMAPKLAYLYKTQTIPTIPNTIHTSHTTATHVTLIKTHTKLPSCQPNKILTPHFSHPVQFVKRRCSATEKLPKIITIIQTPNNSIQCTALKSLAICNSNTLISSPINLKLKKVTYQVIHNKRNAKQPDLPTKLKSIVFGRNCKVFPKHFFKTQYHNKRTSIDLPRSPNLYHLNVHPVAIKEANIAKESSTRTIDYELSPWKLDYNC